jgi:hypothetical protein
MGYNLKSFLWCSESHRSSGTHSIRQVVAQQLEALLILNTLGTAVVSMGVLSAFATDVMLVSMVNPANNAQAAWSTRPECFIKYKSFGPLPSCSCPLIASNHHCLVFDEP